MTKKSLMQRLLPHLIILGAFLLITVAYLKPVLSGKALLQHDEMQFKGSSKEILDYRVATKKDAFWTNSMFGGMPAYQISVGYPKSMFGLEWMYKFFAGIIPHPVNTILFYMIGFYLLMLSFRVNPWVAGVGALAFAFSSYNILIIEAGHVNKTYAIAFAPFMLAGLNYTLTSKRYILGAALFAVATAMEVKSNHLQITYYVMLMLALFFIYELVRAIKAGRLAAFSKAAVLLAIAGGIGIGSNFTNLYLTNEYVQQTQRGKAELKPLKGEKAEDPSNDGLNKDYALAWSQGVAESWTFLVPDFAGGPSASFADPEKGHPKALSSVEDPNDQQILQNFDQYWGDQPVVGGPVYFGAIVMFLFLLGMIFLKGQIRWWILGITVLSVMLSWGRNFEGLTDFFFNYVPFYNKFRSVSMTLIIASITMPVLAFLVLDKVLRNPELIMEQRRKLFIAAGVVGGFALLIAIMPSVFGDYLKPNGKDMDGFKQQIMSAPADQLPENQKQMYLARIPSLSSGLEQARQAIATSDAWRSFFFILLAGGLIYAYARFRFAKEALVAGVGLLVLIDMAVVANRYLNDKDFKPKRGLQTQPIEESPSDQAIMQDKDPNYRVANLTVSVFNDATTSYFHKSIGGYHAAKLRRYQDLMDRELSTELQNVNPRDPRFEDNMRTANVLNMLNTKYFIFGKEANAIYKNNNALGNAWFVNKIEWVNNADEEMAGLRTFNPKTTALSDKLFKNCLKATKTEWTKSGSIKQDVYAPGLITYSSNSDDEQFAVFSEIFYNAKKDKCANGDWECMVDGKITPIIRVNYTLRGISLPAGNHKIEFNFVPKSYVMGENISLASSIGVLLLLVGGIFVEARRKEEVIETDAEPID